MKKSQLYALGEENERIGACIEEHKALRKQLLSTQRKRKKAHLAGESEERNRLNKQADQLKGEMAFVEKRAYELAIIDGYNKQVEIDKDLTSLNSEHRQAAEKIRLILDRYTSLVEEMHTVIKRPMCREYVFDLRVPQVRVIFGRMQRLKDELIPAILEMDEAEEKYTQVLSTRVGIFNPTTRLDHYKGAKNYADHVVRALRR